MKAIGDSKYCPRCKMTLSLDKFSKCDKYPDGLRVYCFSCRNAYEKELYYKNLDRSRSMAAEKQKKFRSIPDNAEKGRAFSREYYHLDPKKAISRRREWRNSENGRKKMILQNLRRRKSMISVINDLSSDDIDFLLNFQENACACCGTDFSVAPYTVDHVIPVSLGGHTTLNNIQLLCKKCNSSKHTKTILYRKPIAIGGLQ